MRLLLDEHFSDRGIGRPLRAEGHDVVAVAGDPELEGTRDETLLEFARMEQRIVVTNNVRHFALIVREWGEAGQSHAGCVLVQGIDNGEFGRILRGLRLMLEERPDQEQWSNLTLWLTPGAGSKR